MGPGDLETLTIVIILIPYARTVSIYCIVINVIFWLCFGALSNKSPLIYLQIRWRTIGNGNFGDVSFSESADDSETPDSSLNLCSDKHLSVADTENKQRHPHPGRSRSWRHLIYHLAKLNYTTNRIYVGTLENI